MGRHHDIPIKYHKIKNTFILKRKIGKGSFGIIYSADNINTKERVAVKFEKVSIKRKTQTLLKEAKILHLLYKEKVTGFPKIVYFNKDDHYRMLIMSLLGRNLQRCLEKSHNSLSLATVMKIAVQMIDRLENLHRLGYIHRDLKPENICTDLKKSSDKIFLIDLGLSKRYLDDNGKHILIREKRGLVGTIRYTSINSHLSIEQSRRDDMESLGYILVYLAKSKLPWQGLIFFDEEMRMRRIAELKCSIKIEKLAEGLPRAFELFLKHSKDLKFTERPDYDYLRGLFYGTAKEKGIDLDEHCFEWQSKSKVRKSNKKLFGKKSSVDKNDGVEFFKKANSVTKDDEKMKTVNNLGEAKPMGAFKNMPFSSNQLKIPHRLKEDKANFSSNMISYESKQSNALHFSQKVMGECASRNSKEKNSERDSFEFDNNLGKVSFNDDVEINKKVASKKSSIFKKMGGGTLKEDLGEDDGSNSARSEDFSLQIMDENISNIQKKINLTTLTKSKLITDVMRKTCGGRKKVAFE